MLMHTLWTCTGSEDYDYGSYDAALQAQKQ